MTSVVAWLDRHQIVLYLLAIAAGVIIGLSAPSAAHPLELAINPILGLLLYATFLGVPFSQINAAVKDIRFLLTVSLVNFVVVPILAFLLSRFVAHDQALLVGVLFVLLTPCVDYVIVFTGLAAGAKDRLLAATPILMLGQMLFLPLYLWLFVGSEIVDVIEVRPFIDAFLFLILLPLLAAGLTQLLAARTSAGRVVMSVAGGTMVPLMMLTLAVVIASQVYGVSTQLGALLATIPLYVAFALIMIPLGSWAGRTARLDVPSRRAIVFSGATRNSLVVLPLGLALPATFALAPLAIVTQTLVELLTMVIFVRLLPRIIRQ
ncbi:MULTISPECIES: arsenic resistance protein [Microbacterium]|uniref:arsenic resistance protein n=1 Tax=Microbacterium TaxID=33882 RepID=UPI0026EC2FC7|nr:MULTISPECIES: bile acid:sodium symporter [Microbacterium]